MPQMVEEELPAHEEEGEVVQRPAGEEKTAKGIVFEHFAYLRAHVSQRF